MENIIEMAREMGNEIMQDERCIALQMAKAANDDDNDLQAEIGEFNLKRVAINAEMNKENKDEEKIEKLNSEQRELYDKIMINPNMSAYNKAKKEADELINHITSILVMSMNGQSSDEGCGGGGCSSCSGCH
jgi:cell fate (sporulation/competence/biofilm development) regulator YlbF (YheA/YmcA/DUF963 family)